MTLHLRPRAAAELRWKYETVRRIPGHRWQTAEGQRFLDHLAGECSKYAQRQVAEALGISQQAVSSMLSRRDELFLDGRVGTSLAELREAHLLVQKWRSLRRVVRRHHETYRRMHDALAVLGVVYPVPTVARLSGIRAQELFRFMEIPDTTSFDDVKLMALLEEYDAGRGLEPARRRRFLQVLEQALAKHPVDVVASLLQVRSVVVRTWMVEKTHG